MSEQAPNKAGNEVRSITVGLPEWRLVEDMPKTDPRTGIRVLMYSRQFGIRTAEAFNTVHGKWANVGNLHGNAIDDWGASHWMPLPEPPVTP